MNATLSGGFTMRSARIMFLAVTGLLAGLSLNLRAEVKTEEKSQVRFEGVMGKMMGIFGGRAAKEGVVSKVAVKGDRKMTVDDYTGQIIDLEEEKVYTLDMRKKSYEVATFEEMRRRLEEAQQKTREAVKTDESGQQPGQKDMEIDFSLKESGQKKNISGFDCREVVMTVTAHEKGKTLEQGGGMVMTSNIWLGPKIQVMKEIEDFDQRYQKALQGPFGIGAGAEQMAAALAMYPAMKEMIGKMQTEQVNMEGTPVLTVTTMELVQSEEQVAQEQQEQKEEQPDITSLGGLGGFLGKKALGKKKQKEQPQSANRVSVMTMNHELLSVSNDVAPADLAVPAGFKEKK
jgi:hypothetical protein